MNLPRLTAEASIYRPPKTYRAVPAVGCDTGAVIAPATAADPNVGFEAVRDYINRIDFTTLKKKLTVPASHGGHAWTPERADAAEAKYKKWLFLQRKHDDVALSPGPPGGEVDTVWHFHILDTEAYIRDTAQIFGRYLHHPPDFGRMGKAVAQYTRRLFRAEYGEDLVTDGNGEALPPPIADQSAKGETR